MCPDRRPAHSYWVSGCTLYYTYFTVRILTEHHLCPIGNISELVGRQSWKQWQVYVDIYGPVFKIHGMLGVSS